MKDKASHAEKTVERLKAELSTLRSKWDNLSKRKSELNNEQSIIENCIEDTTRTLQFLQDGMKLNEQ